MLSSHIRVRSPDLKTGASFADLQVHVEHLETDTRYNSKLTEAIVPLSLAQEHCRPPRRGVASSCGSAILRLSVAGCPKELPKSFSGIAASQRSSCPQLPPFSCVHEDPYQKQHCVNF
jgi:hypothetical protein